MKASEAKELFRQLAEEFFNGSAVVIFTNQSRVAKPQIPLIVLAPGNVSRPQAANTETNDDGVIVGYYLSTMPIIIDLFTNGREIRDDNDEVVAYENTAMDEALAFADYLNSPRCVAWCNTHDLSILIDAPAQDLTGIVNDTNYEYRSRLEVLLSFTQETDHGIGDMGFTSNVVIEESL